MPINDEDPRDHFIDLIEVEKSRVQLEPHVIFVCGGPVDVEATTNHSIRNMFMNLSGAVEGKTEGFVLAENFKDWSTGYNNLSDFENDIAHLSSMVVIFLESEGALAEFGLFFGNGIIRDKLVAVIHSDFHNNDSFINHGLLSPMESKSQSSVKVFAIDHREIDNVSKDEVKEILEDIIEDCDNKDSSVKFDALNRGHQIFLISQIINLFHALTKVEIRKYIDQLHIPINAKEVESALYILQKFNFIRIEKRSSQYFYYANQGLSSRVSLNFRQYDKRRFDTASIKIEVNNFYMLAKEHDRTHQRRINVIKSPDNSKGS